MSARESWDRVAAVAIVVTVEALCAAWLARMRVGTASVPATDDAVTVEFLVRPSPKSRRLDAAIVPPAARRATQAASTLRIEPVAPATRDFAAPDDGGHTARPLPQPLDLTIRARDDTAVRKFAPPAPSNAPRVPGAATRFDAAWQGDGSVLDQARRRSRVLGIALSLFGGPGRHCDEVDRRLRKPECLPEHDDAPPER